jgi:hypothetical protein
MNQKTTFNTVAGVAFLIVAVIHLLRIFYGWEVSVGGLIIPLWVSYLGVVVPGLLSYFGLRKS